MIIFYFYVQGELIPFKSYLQRYATPYAASQSSSPLWYAVRRASAHIIVLSSYSPFGKLLSKHMHLLWFLGKRECNFLLKCDILKFILELKKNPNVTILANCHALKCLDFVRYSSVMFCLSPLGSLILGNVSWKAVLASCS